MKILEFQNKIQSLIDKTKKCVDQALFDAGLKFHDIDEVVFVGGSTRVPYITESVREWTNKNPNKSINPESTNDDIKEYSQIVYKKAKEHVTQKL